MDKVGWGSWRARREPGKVDWVGATADEENAFTWAPALDAIRGEVGELRREGREQETTGGHGEGWDEGIG